MNEKRKIYGALIHHPVKNKEGLEITSAVTNLDIHDLARLARTYGLEAMFIITPDENQKNLAQKIIRHWVEGYGASYNEDRKEALELIKIVDSIEKMLEDIVLSGKEKPLLVSTSASRIKNSITYGKMRDVMSLSEKDTVFLFGTSWGLSDRVLLQSDYVLEPIDLNKGYNHLSVRSAASIVLDRLLN